MARNQIRIVCAKHVAGLARGVDEAICGGVCHVNQLAVAGQMVLQEGFGERIASFVDGIAVAAVGNLAMEQRLEQRHLAKGLVRKLRTVQCSPLPVAHIGSGQLLQLVQCALQCFVRCCGAVLTRHAEHIVAPGAARVAQHGGQVDRMLALCKLLVQVAAQFIFKQHPPDLVKPRLINCGRHTVHRQRAIPGFELRQGLLFLRQLGLHRLQERQQFARLHAALVTLNAGHVVHCQLVAVARQLQQQFSDALRAVRRRPVVCDEVRVVIAHHAVVGGDDEPGCGVIGLRQIFEGNVSGPLVLAIPARHRHAAIALRPDGYAARPEVADVAEVVGEDYILAGRHKVFQCRAKLVPGTGIRCAQKCVECGVSSIQCGPAQRQWLPGAAHHIADERAVACAARCVLERLIHIFYADDLFHDRQVHKFSINLVLVGVIRI